MQERNNAGPTCLTDLDSHAQIAINGGETVGIYPTISQFTYYLVKFCKAAAEYQSSLPANLKK